MSKRVSFNAKPSSRQVAVEADKWVTHRSSPPAASAESMKRLTIDVSEALHRKLKISCAARGVKMADEIRMLLAQHYREET